MSRSPTAGRVPDLARNRARLGAGRLALQQAAHRPADRRAVRLIRLPKLAERRGPILPGFDIHIGELKPSTGSSSAPAVSGAPRSGSVRGKADVRAGRAMVELASWPARGDRSRSSSTPSPTATASTSTCARSRPATGCSRR
jgi:hypothetical protein